MQYYDVNKLNSEFLVINFFRFSTLPVSFFNNIKSIIWMQTDIYGNTFENFPMAFIMHQWNERTVCLEQELFFNWLRLYIEEAILRRINKQ